MENKMKEKPKQLWLEALRSGRYKQTTEILKDENGYCCLGVLCDIYAKTQKKKGFNKTEFDEYIFGHFDVEDYSQYLLPHRVAKWAGIPINPIINNVALSVYNDLYNKSFTEIADLIEKHL